jgi:DNA-binding transcriptional MerR regulator
MPLSRHRDYLSIGEVLEMIRADFPDVSISKIRFLENEGLLAPTRTGSGYRKFYEPDVARLRYILSLQRDQFLPLRVIKERLAQREADGAAPPGLPSPPPRATPPAEVEETPELRLSRTELAERAGITPEQLAGLEDFSVLERKQAYDATDLAIVSYAGGLFGFGVEPRHLRMFSQSAEREASLLAQVVAPLAQRRDSEARSQARRTVARMAELTRQLRWALLRSTLKDHL